MFACEWMMSIFDGPCQSGNEYILRSKAETVQQHNHCKVVSKTHSKVDGRMHLSLFGINFESTDQEAYIDSIFTFPISFGDNTGSI